MPLPALIMGGKSGKYFYCYSSGVANYLSACGIHYISAGYNHHTNSPYKVYERCEKLDVALNGWRDYQLKRKEGELNGGKPNEHED